MNTADDFLNEALKTLGQRGEGYDNGQERSQAKIAAVFNALTGKNLTAEDVCKLLICVKLVRNETKKKDDNIVDLLGYGALLGETQTEPVKPAPKKNEVVEIKPEQVTALMIERADGCILDAYAKIKVMMRRHVGESDKDFRDRVLWAMEHGKQNHLTCTHETYEGLGNMKGRCRACGLVFSLPEAGEPVIPAVKQCLHMRSEPTSGENRVCKDCGAFLTTRFKKE